MTAEVVLIVAVILGAVGGTLAYALYTRLLEQAAAAPPSVKEKTT